ncbi:MAG: alpha/beta hydrolase [Acidimicrobiales bacterium]
MALTWGSEQESHGVWERDFKLAVSDGHVPGVLWRGGNQSRATVLLGHGGTQDKRNPGVRSLARRLVRHLGYSAVAIDAPGHGDRLGAAQEPTTPAEVARRFAQMGEAERLAETARNRQAAEEWGLVLDELQVTQGFDGGPYCYWGVSMGTAIGIPFVASEPRICAAVFGLAGIGSWPSSQQLARSAGVLEVPVLFFVQWDDEVVPRSEAFSLFDVIASREKTMHVNPGGHLAAPYFEREAIEAFFLRNVRATA